MDPKPKPNPNDKIVLEPIRAPKTVTNLAEIRRMSAKVKKLYSEPLY